MFMNFVYEKIFIFQTLTYQQIHQSIPSYIYVTYYSIWVGLRWNF